MLKCGYRSRSAAVGGESDLSRCRGVAGSPTCSSSSASKVTQYLDSSIDTSHLPLDAVNLLSRRPFLQRNSAVTVPFTRNRTNLTPATPLESVEARSLKLPSCQTSRSCESPASSTRSRTALTSRSQSLGAMSTYAMFALSSSAHQTRHTSLASSSLPLSSAETTLQRRRVYWQLLQTGGEHASTQTYTLPARCACQF